MNFSRPRCQTSPPQTLVSDSMHPCIKLSRHLKNKNINTNTHAMLILQSFPWDNTNTFKRIEIEKFGNKCRGENFLGTNSTLRCK
jgi:hypothetical protein